MIAAIDPNAIVERVRVGEEDEYFPLPRSLRSFVTTLQALVEGAYGARHPGRIGPIQQDRDWSAYDALELLTDSSSG